ncbi:MAG: hypothetical protein GTN76_00090 [Candidatus Aenigmarchaeota archaeon]|nr:hypothetical protein [Candidatus Aenigmarchaeota archaeon]
MPGRGPVLVITDLGVYDFSGLTHEMILREIYPGVSVDDIKANISWDIKINFDLIRTKSPTKKELGIIREELDPDKIYLS